MCLGCSGDLSLVQALLQKETVREQIELKFHIQLRKIAEYQRMHHASEVIDGVLKPLHVASFFGRTNIVEYLMDMSSAADDTFEVNLERGLIHFKESKWTALMAAARNDYADTVSLLLTRGGSPDGETFFAHTKFEPETALTMAAKKGHSQCLLQLARGYNKCGLSLDASTHRSALHHAIRGGHLECIRILLDHGANANYSRPPRLAPIMQAINNDHSSAIELLSQYNVDLNARGDNGSFALMFASVKGHESSIKTLVRLGADVAMIDNDGRTACLAAATYGHSSCLILLESAGADVNAVDAVGVTPLMAAAAQGDISSVEVLLNLGAYPSSVSKDGCTAANFAATNGHSGCLEALAKSGADLKERGNIRMMTSLMHAAQNGHYSCLEIVLLHEPKSYQVVISPSGSAAIHFAAWKGHTECVRLLVQHGDDINKRDYRGRTPLDWLVQINKEMDVETKSERQAALRDMGAKSGVEQPHAELEGASSAPEVQIAPKKRRFWR